MAHIGVKCTGTDVPVYMVKIRLDIRLCDSDGQVILALYKGLIVLSTELLL